MFAELNRTSSKDGVQVKFATQKISLALGSKIPPGTHFAEKAHWGKSGGQKIVAAPISNEGMITTHGKKDPRGLLDPRARG